MRMPSNQQVLGYQVKYSYIWKYIITESLTCFVLNCSLKWKVVDCTVKQMSFAIWGKRYSLLASVFLLSFRAFWTVDNETHNESHIGIGRGSIWKVRGAPPKRAPATTGCIYVPSPQCRFCSTWIASTWISVSIFLGTLLVFRRIHSSL